MLLQRPHTCVKESFHFFAPFSVFIVVAVIPCQLFTYIERPLFHVCSQIILSNVEKVCSASRDEHWAFKSCPFLDQIAIFLHLL